MTSTNVIPITQNHINSTNYTGNINYHVFNVTTSIDSFTNNNTVLGGGGSSATSSQSDGKPGCHGILINSDCTVTTLTNNKCFTGGGGGAGKAYDNMSRTYKYPGSNGAAGGGGAGSVFKYSTYQSNSKSGYSFGTNTTSTGICIGGNGGTSTTDHKTGSGNGGGGGEIYQHASTGYGGGGGGGAGGGNGGNGGTTHGHGGGGGGCGGGKGGGGGAGGTIGGKGGYGIQNDGTITTLVNAQCHADCNYGPLFYNGNPPTNYTILINSSTSYGQLYCTRSETATDFTNVTISIARSASGTVTLGTYPAVLVYVTLGSTLPSGTINEYFWRLVKNNTYKYDDNTNIVPVYDLVVASSPAPAEPSGYKINTVDYQNKDLSDIFNAYTSGAKVDPTGYKISGGSDICDIYQRYTSGSTVTTGYKISGGTDVGSLFQLS